MDIKIKVSNQNLKTDADLNNIIYGSQNFIKFIFDLSKDWAELKCFAQFKQNKIIYDEYLDENNSVPLPYNINEGEWAISLLGKDSEIVATSKSLIMTIIHNPLLPDVKPKSEYKEDNSDDKNGDHFTIKSGIGYIPKYTEPETHEYTKEEE